MNTSRSSEEAADGQPLVTVITVCFNAVQSIEATLLSVAGQRYPKLEYIVVDGGSTDGTTDVIRRYADRLAGWVSEPDKGIYDAMNKGIRMSHGDWVLFINSGDTLAADTVLASVFDRPRPSGTGVLYGDVILAYACGMAVARPWPLENFSRFFPFSHPASFVRGNLLKTHLFDLQYRIVADYDLFYRLYKEEVTFEYVPVQVSVFEAETGVSSRRFLPVYREVAQINGSCRSSGWRARLWVYAVKRFVIEQFKGLVPVRLRQRILFNRLLKGANMSRL